MQEYKTVLGTASLNKHVQLGWKLVHAFTKVTEHGEESGTPLQYGAAFVIVWDSPKAAEHPLKPAPGGPIED